MLTDAKRRPQGWRVKHSMARNSVKVYDNASVLRVQIFGGEFLWPAAGQLTSFVLRAEAAVVGGYVVAKSSTKADRPFRARPALPIGSMRMTE